MSGLETADHVSVHLTGCGESDANAVFGALEVAFPEVSEPEVGGKRPPTTPGAATATVWCMVVDARAHLVKETKETVAAGALTGAVTVDLFGAADPVRQVTEELGAAFAVEHLGTVPGEHELEARLRLLPRADT